MRKDSQFSCNYHWEDNSLNNTMYNFHYWDLLTCKGDFVFGKTHSSQYILDSIQDRPYYFEGRIVYNWYQFHPPILCRLNLLTHSQDSTQNKFLLMCMFCIEELKQYIILNSNGILDSNLSKNLQICRILCKAHGLFYICFRFCSYNTFENITNMCFAVSIVYNLDLFG